MKVLIITSSYPENPADSVNAGVFVRAFAKILKEKGHSVHVLTPRKGKDNYDSEVRVTYFWWLGREKTLTNLNFRNPFHIVKAVSLLLAGVIYGLYLCAKTRYDHILAMWAVPSGFIAYLLNVFTYIPYSVWALGSDIWTFSKGKIRRRILKLILKNAHSLFADGYSLSTEVKEISGKECKFLPSSRILPPPQPLSLDRNKKNFLFIGRFHPNKGIDVLIEAISLLPEEIRERSQFYIFGDGPLREKVERMIEGNSSIKECVFLKGYADPETASSYLHYCDALIIPSRIESIPVVLSDAAQRKIPVIVTDVGDMGMLVRKYKCGIVVDCSAESLCEGICTFFEKSREDFEEGLLRFYEDFKPDNAVSEFLKLVSSRS